MSRLELDTLCVSADDFRLNKVSFSVAEGEYFILMGRTGAGKTVLMKTICGFLRPDSGQIRLGGERVDALEPERRGLGYVPQASQLFPHLDVRGNIVFALDLLGVPADEAADRCGTIAQTLNIEPLLSREVGNLSGGERQKAALARALVRNPRLLLLDEPASALDETTRNEIFALLERVRETYGATTLHICHDRHEATRLGDRIGVMTRGELVAIGSPGELDELMASQIHGMEIDDTLAPNASETC
ncbi:MAG: ATP-binding cassette domain-containing protein [Lentisphaeria bacterium]|nr:ATP-binding cassette domain-containing protein [Lentisphaeria bacterium]